jgi:hypothetical protein
MVEGGKTRWSGGRVRKERRRAERPRRRRRTNPRDEVRQRSIDYKGAKAAEEIAELLAVHDVGVLAAGHVLVLLGWMSGKGYGQFNGCEQGMQFRWQRALKRAFIDLKPGSSNFTGTLRVLHRLTMNSDHGTKKG